MARRITARSISKHRSYSVDEAARALGVAKGTVRRWLKDGLPALTDQRPALITGAALIAFLDARAKPPTRCALNECFCFSCRAPRRPAFGEVEFHVLAPSNGNLRALCEVCTTVMHKRVSTAKLDALRGLATVVIKQADGRIDKGRAPCPNDHLKQD